MNQAFTITLMQELHFPEPAVTELTRCLSVLEKQKQLETIEGAAAFFYEHDLDWKLTEPLLEELAKASQLPRYSLDMLFWLHCSETLREAYRQDGVSDRLFLDTMGDLYAKLMECHEVHGIWGTFVSFWYPIFFSRDLIKLGRLEYENYTYSGKIPYEKHGIRLEKGMPVKNIHIPSHFGPLTEEARMDSYRKAYDFFREERNGGPLVCLCHSWLLHQSTAEILPSSSNTVSFRSDFDIIENETYEKFEDAWRVFGADADRPLAELPETTSMQRAYKQYLLSGKKTGAGLGILIFDGEKILR